MSQMFQAVFSKSNVAFRKLTGPLWHSIGLSPGQPRVLEYLTRNDGCIQRELSEACMVEPATVTSVLANIEKKGLIRREVSKASKRETRVYITETGREAVRKLQPIFEQIDETCLRGFTEEEAELYKEFSRRCYKNIMGKDMQF